jgi:DNA invertase Pin-like site-specific DNA recombinase
MSGIRIGYARCSTDRQDLAAQREALVALGVAPDRIYTDHGLTGTARARPGLDQALAAVRGGDTLVVAKLDRLARSVPDARAIAETLAARGVRLAIGATVHDPEDPMGRMFFNILATFAEFEADLIRLRTREGMAIARARGRLRGKKPKLSDRQARELRRMHDTGDYSISDLAELFSVARPTVYRTLRRQPSPDSAPAIPSTADAPADATADAPADPVPAGRSGQNRAGQTGQDRGAAASASPDP